MIFPKRTLVLNKFFDKAKSVLSSMSKILISEEPQVPEGGDLDPGHPKPESTKPVTCEIPVVAGTSCPGGALTAVPGARVMGSEEDPKEYDQLRKVFYHILVSGTTLGAIVFLLMVYWVFEYGGGFDWNDAGGSVNIHIVIMVFFMLYLHGHASLIYRILPAQPKYAVKLMHAGLHLSACIGSAVGLGAAVRSHNIKSQPHFYSLHSWLGIAAISLYYLQFLGGFLTFLVPVTPTNIRLFALPIHRFVGQSLFKLCTGATLTGIMLKAIGSLTFPTYMQFPPAAYVLNFAGFFVILFSIAFGNVLSEYRFRRRPRPGPEGELLLNPGRTGTHGGVPVYSDQSDQAE